MLDPDAMAIITGAAGNLVAHMLNGQVDAARSWITRIFRDGNQNDREKAVRAIEEDARALARTAISEVEARARWSAILATHSAEHPESIAEIRSVAETSAMNIGQQHNYGSGTFIGRDNYGSITGPEE